MGKNLKAVRGAFFDFVDDPWKYIGAEEKSARFFTDGLLVIEDGRVAAFGEYDRVAPKFPGVDTTHIKQRLILPGFVDGHVHMPQTRVLGSFGQQLLPWLQQWIFPEERKYKDPAYAKQGAKHFFENLLASGTTTALTFTTTDPVSTEAFFEAANERNMLMIGGVMALDRFAPEDALNTPEQFYRDSKAMMSKWHGKGRNLYAITPRFALGSTAEMMSTCERLRKEHPDVWVNTHVSENPAEIKGVLDYHQVPDYLTAYEKYQLVGPKFVGGHGVWLSDDEFRRISQAGAAISFCPLSNLFLGSGLFRLGRATCPEHRVKLSFGSDVGGGNRFSMLSVLDEAYKVGMCNNTILDGSVDPRAHNAAEAERNKLSPYRAFYTLTLGGAESLYLDKRIGNFDVGKEADFVVLDWTAGPKAAAWHASMLTESQVPQTMQEAAQLLFAMMMVGDDRSVDETWIMGEQLYKKLPDAELARAR